VPNITVSEQLDTVIPPFDQSSLQKDRFVNSASGFEVFQIGYIQYDDLLFKNIGKPTLWETSVDRHLPTLVSGANPTSGAGFDPLRTAAAGFPLA
jgi:hypothetical protein